MRMFPQTCDSLQHVHQLQQFAIQAAGQRAPVALLEPPRGNASTHTGVGQTVVLAAPRAVADHWQLPILGVSTEALQINKCWRKRRDIPFTHNRIIPLLVARRFFVYERRMRPALETLLRVCSFSAAANEPHD